MSDIVKQAKQIVIDNGFADKVTVIQGKVPLIFMRLTLLFDQYNIC